MVALIEKESGYKFDKVGDDGHSIGYMQIYEECHRDRMERLNVTDLTNPYQNVLVGIDYLSELIERYGTIQDALAAYASVGNIRPTSIRLTSCSDLPCQCVGGHPTQTGDCCPFRLSIVLLNLFVCLCVIFPVISF